MMMVLLTQAIFWPSLAAGARARATFERRTFNDIG
jgi:hypothetical protein